jgi:hypothetical protein
MDFKRILWLEDQSEDFTAYRSALYRSGRVTDRVRSVSEAVKKLRENGKEYTAVIFDLKVLPGNDPEWLDFDRRQKKADPHHDPYLGLELLRSLFTPDRAGVKLAPSISLSPQKVIVFFVAFGKTQEIAALGIPEDRIIDKTHSDLSTLPDLIEKIEEECKESNI